MPAPTGTLSGIYYIFITTKDQASNKLMGGLVSGTVTQLHSSATRNFSIWLWEDCEDAEIGLTQQNPLVLGSSCIFVGATIAPNFPTTEEPPPP